MTQTMKTTWLPSLPKNETDVTYVDRPVSANTLQVPLVTYVTGLAPAGTGQQTSIFFGNNPHRPFQPSAGFQPLGFDQYMAIYNRYHCLASKIRVYTWSTTDTTLAMLGVQPNSTNSVTNTMWYIQPKTKLTQIGGSQSSNSCTITEHYATTAEILNVTDVTDNPQLGGGPTSNPLLPWYWIISYQHPVTGGTISGLTVHVEITYYCQLSRSDQISIS